MNSALRPLWLSSVLLGAGPLDFAPCQKASFVYQLLVFGLIGVYCPVVAMSMHAREIPEFIAAKDSRATTVSVLGSVFSVLTVIVAVLVLIYIINSGGRLAAVQRDVREICAELRVSIDKRVHTYVTLFVFVFWPMLVFWMYKEIVLYGDNALFYVGIEESINIIGRGMQIIIEMQICIHVLMQKWIFEAINAEIQILIYTTESTKEYQTLERLEKIRRSHLFLCELGEKVCEIFERLLAVLYPMLILDIVQGLFYSLVTLLDYIDDNPIKGLSLGWKIFIAFDCVAWSTVCLGRFATITNVCESSTNEAVETRNLVQKLEQVETRASLKEEILRFSVQLQHVPRPIYSVYGMYKINSELLTQMVTSAIAYMVIIMQFHNLQVKST